MDAFEIESGALPHYKLFDRKGELRATFAIDPSAAEQFTPEDVAEAIIELLEEPSTHEPTRGDGQALRHHHVPLVLSASPATPFR